MNYTLEEIYLLVGKDDKTAGVTFKYGSNAYELYGSFVTVLFLYTQFEREDMDKMIKSEPFSQHGILRAKYLGTELSKEKIQLLSTDGINSKDIAEIIYTVTPTENTFHSNEKRTIKKLQISINTASKGGDLDWMYGFSKRFVSEGIGLSPEERDFYLAGRLYYEPEDLSEGEAVEVFDVENNLKEGVEWELLQIKYMRGGITNEEKQRLSILYNKRKRDRFLALDRYLKHAGSSVKKLAENNIEQAAELYSKVMRFKQRRFNVMGKHPIYIDLDSYLHIYMRHVEEFQVNRHFEHKDNFQWKEEDIFSVMRHVIEEIDVDYQKHKTAKPTQRYSRYGRQSVYYEGDYYTTHIEPTGRISTFYKNRKKHEQRVP